MGKAGKMYETLSILFLARRQSSGFASATFTPQWSSKKGAVCRHLSRKRNSDLAQSLTSHGQSPIIANIAVITKIIIVLQRRSSNPLLQIAAAVLTGESVLEGAADPIVIDDPVCRGSEDVKADGIPVLNPLTMESSRVLLELPRAIVPEPITSSPDESNDTGVPLNVIAEAPGVRVLLASKTAFRSAVRAWPAMVVTNGFATGVTNEIVLEPTIS